MRFFLACSSTLFFSLIGCASRLNRPPGASFSAPSEQRPAFSQVEQPFHQEPPEPNAVVLLSQALEFYRARNFAAASTLFQNALASQTLSPAGRILTYWHLWSSEQALAHEALAMEALGAFVSASEDMMDLEIEDSAAAEEADTFSERFALAHKLAYARAAQNLMWSQRHASFGRSRAHPIVIRSQAELNAYLTLLPRCAQDTSWQVLDRSIALGTPSDGLLWVRLLCGQNAASMELFFEHHVPAEKRIF